jgi:anti-sigma factor RsiW
MNCRRFQNDLYEYLEGSLSPKARAAAEKHLSECAACRQRLGQEQQVARSLANGFQRAVEPLQLPPSVGRRVLAAMADEGRAAREVSDNVLSWRRLAWPLALAASLLLLLGGWAVLLRAPGPGETHPERRAAESDVSIQLSYVVPVYTFRQEGGFVVDALTYQTNVVNERLYTELARLP